VGDFHHIPGSREGDGGKNPCAGEQCLRGVFTESLVELCKNLVGHHDVSGMSVRIGSDSWPCNCLDLEWVVASVYILACMIPGMNSVDVPLASILRSL
jgi:hypothetical protein